MIPRLLGNLLSSAQFSYPFLHLLIRPWSGRGIQSFMPVRTNNWLIDFIDGIQGRLVHLQRSLFSCFRSCFPWKWWLTVEGRWTWHHFSHIPQRIWHFLTRNRSLDGVLSNLIQGRLLRFFWSWDNFTRMDFVQLCKLDRPFIQIWSFYRCHCGWRRSECPSFWQFW